MQISTDRPVGLRARKKEKTREALTAAAMRLYQERGWEGVTVAEIACMAEVAPRTFFAYFESKEDVFLARGDDRLGQLVEAIRSRDRREPILAAVRRALRDHHRPRRFLERSTQPNLVELLRHPAITQRLRERWNRWEDLLAEAIASDVGARPNDPEPRVLAAAVTGAIRIAALAAEQQPRRRTEIADRAFDLLATGLSQYGATEG